MSDNNQKDPPSLMIKILLLLHLKNINPMEKDTKLLRMMERVFPTKCAMKVGVLVT